MSSCSDVAITGNPTVLGCGQLCLDYLVTVSSFPIPDQKIRGTSSKVQRGGNTGNALTCVARLGWPSRILAKVADDSQGSWMLNELESSGVDTSFCVTAKDGASHFNYVIVDNQTHTRTCIFSPGYPPLLPDDLTESLLLAVLDGVRILYVNGRSREAELLLAQMAHSKNTSILINAEKRREGLNELLDLADYAICSTNFPQDWTQSTSSPSALLSMLITLPQLKFVIMTLGESGCMMLDRCSNGALIMSSCSDVAITGNPIVLGCGQLCLDYLVTVSSFPIPDQKIRGTSSKVQGGGNTGNALTCVARLGLPSRILAKVADDSQGSWMLNELESSGVDTSFCVTAKDGASHFNYVIVDNQTHTRTCIFSPGYPPLLPDDLTESLLLAVLDGVRILYVNGRSREAELLLAQMAHSKNISILINAEKRRGGLNELLDLADYAICSTNFPQDWTQSTSSPSALLSMLITLPQLKFVIMTLGESGCMMLERCSNEISSEEVTDIDELHASLKQSTDFTSPLPVCNSSSVARLTENVTGRLVIVTAEKIPSSELMDTTGAGDAFTGAVLYGLCTQMASEEMLTFASRVAACCCRGLGARTTLPFRTDPNLAAFFGARL